MTSRYTYVTEAAADTTGMTNHEAARFHYFNENGLRAAKDRVNQKIVELVEAGLVPNGWYLAYGSLSDSYQTEKLYKLVEQKRVSEIKLQVWIEMQERAIDHAEEKIAGVSA